MSERKTGTVKWFNTEKGQGFTVNEDGEDVFIHYRSIHAEGFKNLAEGDRVEFLQVKSEKGWQAAEALRLESESAQKLKGRNRGLYYFIALSISFFI